MYRPQLILPLSFEGSDDMNSTTQVEWHGGKEYGRCPVCQKLVQNKPILGGAHFCLTDCEQFGHQEMRYRRRGPFWNRRTEGYCPLCYTVLSITTTPKKVRS
jgi:hypothetical protein